MGMIQCQIHGLTGIELLCPHVWEAQKSQKKIVFNPVLDEFGLTMWVCTDCIELFKRLSTDDDLEKFEHSLQPSCMLCFDEWKESIK